MKFILVGPSPLQEARLFLPRRRRSAEHIAAVGHRDFLEQLISRLTRVLRVLRALAVFDGSVGSDGSYMTVCSSALEF